MDDDFIAPPSYTEAGTATTTPPTVGSQVVDKSLLLDTDKPQTKMMRVYKDTKDEFTEQKALYENNGHAMTDAEFFKVIMNKYTSLTEREAPRQIDINEEDNN